MKYIDLSHVIDENTLTYKGLPAPIICDFWERQASAKNYDDGSSFQIGKIELISNTGTYIDSPFHRFEHGKDLSEILIERCVDLKGLLIDASANVDLEVGMPYFENLEVSGKAVLIYTGWSKHFNSDAYFEPHPYLSESAAAYLAVNNAVLVGIDSYNIDNTQTRNRPVHTLLLGKEILIVEHLTNLSALLGLEFEFSALPPKIKGMGTFPVRAIAKVV
jgi:arylformamidase